MFPSLPLVHWEYGATLQHNTLKLSHRSCAWNWSICTAWVEVGETIQKRDWNNSLTTTSETLSLQATSEEEIQIGCWAIKGFTHEKSTEIKIYHTNFSKPGNNKKSCYEISESDCWCSLTFTQPILAFFSWGKCGVELLFDFMIVKCKL